MTSPESAIVFAGIPERNNSLYHRLRFSVGDPSVFIQLPEPTAKKILILRDIEMERARQHARVDEVYCPADFAPASGLSGDRETATAQAAAEFLVRHKIERVIADRTLAMIYVHHMLQRSLQITCDLELGVTERRVKDKEEIAWLQEAQTETERAMELACGLVAHARADKQGGLHHDGAPLTSERVRAAIDLYLIQKGYANPTSIVAGGTVGADCHNSGEGPLFTGQPVIIDIFPQNRQTKYNGDCTRTVVHGEVPDRVRQMHAAVVAAKKAATLACRAGASGADVHAATTAVIMNQGFAMGLPTADAAPDLCAMVHGTGHGIGLDIHEPPLLDKGGPPLVVGDAVTIEPGLYCRQLGGVRVEDMVIVEADGCRNLNRLPEGLDWS
jgi:Xaa-Pro aminopeptidase